MQQGQGPSHMTISGMIQSNITTLGRKVEHLVEMAEQIAAIKEDYQNAVSFYEQHMQRFLAQMQEVRAWGESQEKLLTELQTKVTFPIELPKKPEFLIKKVTGIPSPKEPQVPKDQQPTETPNPDTPK